MISPNVEHKSRILVYLLIKFKFKAKNGLTELVLYAFIIDLNINKYLFIRRNFHKSLLSLCNTNKWAI